MSTAYQIVVCAGIVPDPLQTLEPVALDDPASGFTEAGCAGFGGVGDSDPRMYTKRSSQT